MAVSRKHRATKGPSRQMEKDAAKNLEPALSLGAPEVARRRRARVLAEQVADLLVVDLDVRDLHLVGPAARPLLRAVGRDLLHGPRDDAAHGARARALHRVRLARACVR